VKGYYFITDRTLSKNGNASDVRMADRSGVPFIQYREKNMASRKMYEEALALKALCTKSRFIVNDRLDIALAVDADGIHIGQEDIPPAIVRRLAGKRKIVGVSVTSVEEAIAAEEAGADYLGVSPIFATNTKADAGSPVGISLIIQIKKAVKLPVAAIGGITLANAKSVIEAGADMISAISAVVGADDVLSAIQQFEELFP
jgi:thiamine-phosphate pyrophosphorylase